MKGDDTVGLEQWADRPLRVAENLNEGVGDGQYLDACLLVSGIISGIASFIWPGDKGDRRRFIETWVRFSDPDGDANRVSVPLLRARLQRQGKTAEVTAIDRARPNMFSAGYMARVLRGHEVDAHEAILRGDFPSLDPHLLRLASYPTIFYEHVRCKAVHEGELDGLAAQFPMARHPDARVSYVNRTVVNMGGPVPEHERDRRIFFHLPWLTEVTRTMARNADAALKKGPVEKPATWWIDEHAKRPAPQTTVKVALGKKTNVPPGSVNVCADSVDTTVSPAVVTLTFTSQKP
jgi:hypothetical protein